MAIIFMQELTQTQRAVVQVPNPRRGRERMNSTLRIHPEEVREQIQRLKRWRAEWAEQLRTASGWESR